MKNSPLYRAARRVVECLRAAGHEAYFAGGAVRDLLLGRPFNEIDIATAAPPDTVQALFARTTDLQGKSFGVIRVLEGGFVFEVATFRVEGPYLDGRRPSGVRFGTAPEDAQRRDFTVNGMFLDPLEDRIIDHVGGRADLDARLLRAIGDPAARFREDHLRLHRAVRFAANLGFDIHPPTWDAVCGLAPLTASLAPERVRDELNKALTGPSPLRAFDLLDASGLFRVCLPEIETLKGVAQPPDHHPEGDVFVHTRLMMEQLRDPDPVLAWSVLLHDIAKPATFSRDDTGRIRFTGHETRGARMAEDILRRLRFPNDFIAAVSACVANHMAFKDAPQMRVSTLKRFLARPHFPVELELHRIDCTACHGDLSIHQFLKSKQEEFAREPIRPAPLVTGADLLALGLKPGPRVGKLLDILYDEQLEGRFRERDTALARARELVQATTGIPPPPA